MKRLAKKALGAFKNPKKVARLTGKQFYVLFRFGPVEYGQYLKRAVGRHMFIHNFPNGIKTSLDTKKARNWHLLNRKSLVVVMYGKPAADTSLWMKQVANETCCEFIVPPALKEYLGDFDEESYRVLDNLGAKSPDLFEIKHYIQRYYRGYDVLLVDMEQPRFAPFDVVRLQHAAYAYDDDREVGFVAPAYLHHGEVIAGFEYSRKDNKWTPAGNTEVNYDQQFIPRYTLTTLAHGLYMTHHTIQRLLISQDDLDSENFDEQIGAAVQKGWNQNIRTLTFSPVIIEVTGLKTPKLTDEQAKWLSGRRPGKKVIYVLNATSVSGGIRVIFEHANGLLRHGFDVEIWSLQGQPTWTDLNIQVKKFRTYSDLLLVLRNEDAIKVATWWETDQVVWLGSVNLGIPVNFIQEFETWFYPDDPIARSAVVSSYRKEFAYMTTADYQRDELAKIGIDAPIIPVGYEAEYYHQEPDVKREDDVVLSIGRSFFQKNFAMTARAWESLGAKRPRLYLFGGEPDVLKNEKATYHLKPSNAEVNTLYNQATCFVQTSRHEGFCLPVIEAMAAGCPVITTDSHGNRGFCFDGKNCLIVGQDDDRALAAAIEKLLGDKALQEKFRKAGLETAKEYEWAGILDRVAKFYRAL